MQKMFGRSVGLPLPTSTCHQIPCHPFRNHGGLHIVVEWGHNLKNVGLQHKILTHYGQWMLLWEGGTWLVTFRQNCVKMAWASMNIMRWCQFITCNFWHMLHEFDEPFTSLIGVFLECLKHHGARLSFIESLEVNELRQTHVMITLTHVVLCWGLMLHWRFHILISIEHW